MSTLTLLVGVDAGLPTIAQTIDGLQDRRSRRNSLLSSFVDRLILIVEVLAAASGVEIEWNLATDQAPSKGGQRTRFRPKFLPELTEIFQIFKAQMHRWTPLLLKCLKMENYGWRSGCAKFVAVSVWKTTATSADEFNQLWARTTNIESKNVAKRLPVHYIFETESRICLMKQKIAEYPQTSLAR